MNVRSFCLVLLLACCVQRSWSRIGDELDEATSRRSSKEFVDMCRRCVRTSAGFDDCVKNIINNAQDFYKTGIPKLGLPPIDPLSLPDIHMSKAAFELNLTNIMESSWGESTINRFKSSVKSGGYVQFSQFCPELFIEGRYRALGKGPDADGFQEGAWNFTLYDMHRTIVIARNKLSPEYFKVKLSIHEVSNVELHISDAAGDNLEREHLENQFFNSFMMFGFPMVRPMVEDLLASSYSRKITEVFGNFDWDQLFPVPS